MLAVSYKNQLKLIALCWGLNSSFSPAAQFHVIGEIEATIFDSVGHPQQKIPARFQASVRDNVWQIEGYFFNSNYVVSGCDGTNVHTLLYDIENEKKWANSPRPAWITPGTYPVDCSWQIAIPWLAFASAAYFGGNEDRLLPGCWGEPRHEAEMWIFQHQVTNIVLPPFLPLNVSYTVEKALQFNATTNAELLSAVTEDQIARSIFQYPPGFRCGEYNVLSTTNWNGLTLPLTFEIRRFYPKYTPRGQYLGAALIVHFQGKLNSVSSNVLANFLPESDRQISISDFRFAERDVGVDFIRYQSPNHSWSPLDETALRQMLLARSESARQSLKYFLKKKHAGHASGIVHGRSLAIALVAAVLSLPVILLLLNRLKTIKQ